MMRSSIRVSLGLMLAVLLSGVPALAQDGADERAFAEQALPQIRAAYPEATVTLEPGEPLQVNVRKMGESEDAQINLHRVFGYCRNAPEADCTTELARLIAVLASVPAGVNPEVKALRIIVRDAEYWTYVRQSQLDALPLHRQIGDDLYAILAFDSPEAIAIAPADRIAELGLSEENAWLFAARQTAAIIPGLPENEAIGASLVVFQSEEYAGSLMAYPDRWAKLAAASGPDLAVIVNSDQFVIASIAPDGPDLVRFRALAQEQCGLAARCISPNVYRWREGRWVIAR